MHFETVKPPNKHTKAMGELIRKAREEAGLSQEELAKKYIVEELLFLIWKMGRWK
ncbi:MAG TPA: hypothetical protein G4N92_07110 [Anaerolineae bacterium]|nr:hypothetical protein [Anaerolineae bacterium]